MYLMFIAHLHDIVLDPHRPAETLLAHSQGVRKIQHQNII
jgi:hypothetical protein